MNEFLRTEMFSRNEKGETLILVLCTSRGDSFMQEAHLSLSHCFFKVKKNFFISTKLINSQSSLMC